MMTIIVAVTRDGAIGRGGDMIHHIKGDLRRFKAITMGHPIVMGRRTLESFPKGPLPGRRNIVVSRRTDYHPDGVEVYPSLEAALEAAGDDAYIIGGGEVYRQAIPMADRLLITEIDDTAPDADTHFPEIGDEWTLTEEGEWQAEEGVPPYRYLTYTRP